WAEPKCALRSFDGRFGLPHPSESDRTAAKREDIGVAQRQRAVEQIKRRGVVMLVERNDERGYRQRGRIVAAPSRCRVGVPNCGDAILLVVLATTEAMVEA